MLGMLQGTKRDVPYKSMRYTWWRNWWRRWSVLRLLLWTIWVIYRERKRVIRARERGNYEVQPNVQVLIQVLTAFRQTALKLGVLMIKLGQFLSSRADLLPEQALAVLTSLQDEVPPEPFDHVIYSIERELKQPVESLFSVIERKCTAAASLGQVHKAVLAGTGETVAVKIQRPHIEQLVTMDLSTLKLVIWICTRFVKTDFIDLWGIYHEFSRTVYEETDFTLEAANAKRFAEMFKDDPTIYIPRIYDEYVTQRVLILEWIDGIKINDYTTIDELGLQRLEAANRTVRAYFHQFFEEGFFHADPHPGNILIRKDSNPKEPVIAFVDFGMVGTITKSMKKSMSDIFLGFLTKDARKMTMALQQLGFIGADSNLISIEKAMSLMLGQYYGITLNQARTLDMSEVGREVENLLYGQAFHIPAQFAFTGRAISTLIGVSTGLAPEFNFISVAQPYAASFIGLNANNVRETLQNMLTQIIDSGRILMTLPHSIDRLITRIDSGQLEVKLSNQSEKRRGRRGRRNMGAITARAEKGSSAALIIIFLTSLAGGIYLDIIHIQEPGWFCLGLAGITALVTMLKRS